MLLHEVPGNQYSNTDNRKRPRAKATKSFGITDSSESHTTALRKTVHDTVEREYIRLDHPGGRRAGPYRTAVVKRLWSDCIRRVLLAITVTRSIRRHGGQTRGPPIKA